MNLDHQTMELKERREPLSLLKMEQDMKESGMNPPIRGMAEATKFGLMGLSMKGTGKTIKLTVGEG